MMKGYEMRPAEKILLRSLERKKGLKVVILEGPPGTGKTYFSECLSTHFEAEYIYYLCHHWTGDEEMFVSVHVGKVVVGVSKPEDAYEYGILTKAALASQIKRTVLCLDELDKAPQRAESLLLDFLQHGRVFLPDGNKIQGKLENLTVCLTTNNCRPLMEATLRRGFRLKMEFLAPNIEADIIRKATGASMGTIRCVVRMMEIIRQKGATAPSLQEGKHLVEDLAITESYQDVEILVKGWLIKESEDWEALIKEMKNPSQILWGEFKRSTTHR
jgi:MoxR-like ATPase